MWRKCSKHDGKFSLVQTFRHGDGYPTCIHKLKTYHYLSVVLLKKDDSGFTTVPDNMVRVGVAGEVQTYRMSTNDKYPKLQNAII